MNISVAMCTFNGARHLTEQLESIAAQSRLPEELVVCDDQSADATVNIVRQFAARAPFEVQLCQNDGRLGAAANFAKAIGLCRGRLILLADQDDVWLPEKVHRIDCALSETPAAAFAMSDAALVDPERRPLRCRLWKMLRFSPRLQRQASRGRAFDVLLRRNVVTGATLAFRAEYRELLLPIPPGWVHDAWIGLLLSAVARCALIPQPLIEYRQHASQQIGENRSSFYQQYLRGRRQTGPVLETIADNYAAAQKRLMQFQDRLPDAAVLAALQAKVDHYRAKVSMRRASACRLPIIARELLRRHYSRYSQGWRSLAQDLFL